jgi:hypothetical protein
LNLSSVARHRSSGSRDILRLADGASIRHRDIRGELLKNAGP